MIRKQIDICGDDGMKYKLEDLFDLQMGKTPARNNPEYWNSADNKWISIGDLSKCGKYITNTKEYLSDTAVEESGISLIPENTVVMSFKLSIGKTAITSEPMYSNEAIMSFRDKHVVPILPDYLYYMFSAKDWDEGTNKAVMGKTLNKATLAKVTIDVHSPTEQRKIVDTLDKVASVIDARRQQLSALDDLIKARFVEMFGESSSKTGPLKECCLDIRGGGTPSMQYPEYYGGNVPFIKSGDVRGDVVMSGALWLSDKALSETSAKYVPAGSVLVVNRSAALLKEFRAAIAGQPVVINQDIKAFVPKPEFTSEYLLWAIKIQTQYLLTKVTTVLTSHIDLKDLLDLRIVAASTEHQDAFSAFVAQIDKSKSVIQKSLDETQLLFDSLMQQHFG